MADRLTGKASYLVYGGTQIPITKATPKVSRKLADATDNGDYNSQADLLFPTQLAVNAPVELSIEGRYRKSVTPALFATVMQSNPGGLQANLGLDSGTLVGHGFFDISDFQCDVPVDDIVTFSCTMKSNGQFIPNS